MNAIETCKAPASPARELSCARAAVSGVGALSTGLTLLLATGAGVSVATLYDAQPMLGVLGDALHASSRRIGLVPTATQFGYAMALLFLAPLGDRFDRRRIILIKAALLTLALLFAASAGTIDQLVTASLGIGIAASLAQDIVPAAAILAPPAHRGRAVGMVMTGLLLGILTSRVSSGLIAERFGWRAVFFTASMSIAATGVAIARRLPRFAATTNMSYGRLLASLSGLAAKHPRLRRAAVAQGLLSAGFSAFWCTLAVMLYEAPFHLGSAAAGAFGLAGAAGAFIAPVAGRLADRRGPELVTRLATLVATLSFLAMTFAPMLSARGQLVLLALATVGFDLGVQATLVSHQTIVYALDPGARSRLNAVLFVSMFVAMAIGAVCGSLLLSKGGWTAVVGYAAATSLAAFVVRMWPAGAGSR